MQKSAQEGGRERCNYRKRRKNARRNSRFPRPPILLEPRKEGKQRKTINREMGGGTEIGNGGKIS